MNNHDWLDAEYAALEQVGLRRHLRTVMSAPTGTVNLDGRDVVLLGSNNYLGLSTHPQVITAAIEATRTFGTGASGSRLISGNNELYTTLEANLAKTKNTEAALVFSSGYAANTSIIPVLAGEDNLILSDALNHASIIDGCRLSRATKKVYRHCDVEHLKASVTVRIHCVSAATHRDGRRFQYGRRYRTATRYLRSRYTIRSNVTRR